VERLKQVTRTVCNVFRVSVSVRAHPGNMDESDRIDDTLFAPFTRNQDKSIDAVSNQSSVGLSEKGTGKS
jgi:hypothetical protein